MDAEVSEAMQDLRQFMFRKVYKNPVAKGEESKAKALLQQLFAYYMAHPEALPEAFQPQLSFDGMARTVCDYIAGMTDKYAVDKFTELFVPSAGRCGDETSGAASKRGSPVVAHAGT